MSTSNPYHPTINEVFKTQRFTFYWDIMARHYLVEIKGEPSIIYMHPMMGARTIKKIPDMFVYRCGEPLNDLTCAEALNELLVWTGESYEPTAKGSTGQGRSTSNLN